MIRRLLVAALCTGCLTDDSIGGEESAPGPPLEVEGGEALDAPAGTGEGEGEGEAQSWTGAEIAGAQARGRFPDFAAFSAGVIHRTCSPNPGVCHQTNNYPDLHTDANVLAIVGAPCNIEMPDPSDGWDRCERAGDILEAGGWRGTIGAFERLDSGRWMLWVKPPPDISGLKRPRILRANGDVLLDPPQELFMGVRLKAGDEEVELTVSATVDAQLFVDDILTTIIPGDPNGNGVYGAQESDLAGGTLVNPGDLAGSYLWGRVTGTAPGFRMPLANQPLTLDEYVALACWIEGLPADRAPKGDDPIDYDGCAFAANPIDYTEIEE